MIDLGRETDGNNEICLGVHFALCIIHHWKVGQSYLTVSVRVAMGKSRYFRKKHSWNCWWLYDFPPLGGFPVSFEGVDKIGVLCLIIERPEFNRLNLSLRQAWTDHTFFFSGRFFSIWVYLVDVIWHKNKSEEGKN